jgi:ribosomal protein L44E
MRHAHEKPRGKLGRPDHGRGYTRQECSGSAEKAAREADLAEAEARSIRMEGYGGPAQPSPKIAQCLRGGLGWLEVECNRCKTRASLPCNQRF